MSGEGEQGHEEGEQGQEHLKPSPLLIHFLSSHCTLRLMCGFRRPQEQTEVLRVLDQETDISHYAAGSNLSPAFCFQDPDDLRQAKRLSDKDARHAVYALEPLEAQNGSKRKNCRRYQGERCVVKVFDLHTHGGLPGFMREVMLHVRPAWPVLLD